MLLLTEAVNLLGSGKTPLSEYFADKGYWPSQPADVMGQQALMVRDRKLKASGFASLQTVCAHFLSRSA